MKHQHHARLTMAVATAALLSLPLAASAQPPATQPPPAQPPVTQQPPPTQPAPPAQPPAPPAPDPTMPPTTQPPATPPPAGTTGESTQAPPRTPATPSGGAIVLLDRISEIIDQSLGQKPASKSSRKGTPGATGTSGVKVGKSAAGTVVVERAALDEIKAEIQQLKIMLKDKQPLPRD
jgi:hypothetical protein